MQRQSTKGLLAVAGLAVMLSSPLAMSHLDDKAIPQSYRQSYFTLLALNFGPLVAMVKGEIPWDAAAFDRYANDLATVTALDLARGFPPGSETGQTRAKPEIWQNMADFNQKTEDMKTAAGALKAASAGGDKTAIMEAFKQTGGACKACHDEYKSEDYLN